MGRWLFGYVQSASFVKSQKVMACLIILQPEFRPILFPIFCHFYLDLIQHGFKDAGMFLSYTD